jgi:hypothetical protein
MSNDEMIIGSGTVRARGSRETFKGVKGGGFSCGLGNEDCEMFKSRGGNNFQRLRSVSSGSSGGSAGGMFERPANTGGVYFPPTGPRFYGGNNAFDLMKGSRADKQVIAANNQKQVLTSNSDQTIFTSKRVSGGNKISAYRDLLRSRENFTGKTFDPDALTETFKRSGAIGDYSVEKFTNKCGRENMARRGVVQPQVRNKMNEQYMTKIPATKGGGLRAQYGL